MSAPLTAVVDEAALPALFREALDALRTRVLPSAAVEVIEDNFAWLCLGDTALSDDLYTVPSTRLWARVPLTFPDAVPYGIATSPILARADGKTIERQHVGHQMVHALGRAVGRTDLAFYSWDWSNMPTRAATDLVAVVEWARRRLRMG